MRAAQRRALLLVVLATAIPGAARTQTVCDQLLPIGIVPPAGGFQMGCANHYVMRWAGLVVPPGSYAWLAYPPCANGPCAGLTDGLQFVCQARTGYSCCIGVTDVIARTAGIYQGQLSQGLSERYASDTDTLQEICYSSYAGNGARLANVPLILPVGDGSTQVQVIGFLPMFLVRRPAGNGFLVVEFVAEPTPARGRTWGRTKILYR
jgi:hypothetical protein